MSNTTTHSSYTTPARGGGLKAMIRPEWNPVTIAMMIGGFMIAWPLGLAMIAYIIWGEWLDTLKADANRATDGALAQFGRMRGAMGAQGFGRSGNVAFDDWREAEMKRLDEERAKLAAMEAEFTDYQRELRRAKDRDDFDAFLRTRNTVDNS